MANVLFSHVDSYDRVVSSACGKFSLEMCYFSWVGDLPKAMHCFWEENIVISAPLLRVAFFLLICITVILTLWLLMQSISTQDLMREAAGNLQ
jgi:hypothetical protein